MNIDLGSLLGRKVNSVIIDNKKEPPIIFAYARKTTADCLLYKLWEN